jgi:hypothetical protein
MAYPDQRTDSSHRRSLGPAGPAGEQDTGAAIAEDDPLQK